jgi:two-component system sensor histidine kinase/response regulator
MMTGRERGLGDEAMVCMRSDGIRVLLVDDDVDSRKIVDRVLTQDGFIVDTAENGAVAVERVKRERFDVILMDLHMPVMDGFTAASSILTWLSETESPTLPIIPFSTDAPEQHRERCEASGMVSYVRKPASRVTLAWHVRHWVGRLRVERARSDAPYAPDQLGVRVRGATDRDGSG